MPATHSELARVIALLEDTVVEGHSMRFTAAALAMHGLVSSGYVERRAGALVAAGHKSQGAMSEAARVAYDIGEAFLEETVTRLLPGARGSG